MNARNSLAAALVALGLSQPVLAQPVLAQTGNDTEAQTKLERCQTIADPGLKAKCMDEARRTMGADRSMQERPNPDRPGLTPNLPAPDRRLNR
jgi:hypothetical protein